MSAPYSSMFNGLTTAFSTDPATVSAIQGCALAKKADIAVPPKPVPTHECDLVYVDVVIQGNDEEEAPRKLLVPVASGQKGGELRIDVLANGRYDLPGSTSAIPTTLELKVLPFASCGNKRHPLLTVTPSADECDSSNAAATWFSTPIYRKMRPWEIEYLKGDSFSIWNLLQFLWGAISEDNLGFINISVSTCGVRKSGAIVGDIGFPVHIYPRESYSFELSIPPAWGRTVTEKSLRKNVDEEDEDERKNNISSIDKSRKHYVVENETKNVLLFSRTTKNSTETTQQSDRFGARVELKQNIYATTAIGTTSKLERNRVDGNLVYSTYSKADEEAKPWERLGIKLELKRNGSDLKFEVGEFLTAAAEVLEATQKFRQSMKSAVKGEFSVGLTMTGEINFMVMSLAVEWKRKEHASGRAPWHVSTGIKGKLIDASLSAKYGATLSYTCLNIEVLNVELSITLTYAGEISGEARCNARVLDGVWTWDKPSAPIEGKVSASLAGVAKALFVGQGVSATATAKAEIEVKSELEPGDNSTFTCLKGDIRSTGATLTVTTLKPSGTYYVSPPVKLIEPCDILKDFRLGHG